jgi:hypothetical protein
MTKMLSICIALALLVGCNNSVKPSERETGNIAERLSYVKDQHGICYAVVSSSTYGFMDVASITAVPCEKVGL